MRSASARPAPARRGAARSPARSAAARRHSCSKRWPSRCGKESRGRSCSRSPSRSWSGAALGLALAVGFGVLFVRGTLRIPLKPFFSLTTAVLLLISIQLLVGGLHELSEAEVLPASRREMAIIGPLVKNELLLFTL